MKQLSIGLDGGHSMFKVRSCFADTPGDRFSINIPTAVIPAFALSSERAKQQAAADTVHMDGRAYFIGDTALRQGGLDHFTGQNLSWVESIEHDVLVLAAWRRVMKVAGGGPMEINLVLGLPSKLYAAQKKPLIDRTSALLKPYQKDDQHLKVLVQNQGEAPLQWLALNADGTPNIERDLDTQVWAVTEIGHFTTDFSLSDRGTMLEHSSGSCSGMHLVHDAVSREMAAQGLPTSIEHVNTAVRDRKFTTPSETVDLTAAVLAGEQVLRATVLDYACRLFDRHRKMLHGIVVAGGGAPVLIDQLKSTFKQCIMAQDPRSVVAEGLCRVGLLAFKYR